MVIPPIQEFIKDVVRIQKNAIQEAWIDFNKNLGKTKKGMKEFAKLYPDGFKDYLLAYLDREVVEKLTKKDGE